MLGVRTRKKDKSKSNGTWLGPAPWIVTPPPGPRAVAAVSRDERVTSTSYTRPYPLVVARAHGSVVEDVDGNRFLDFTAGIAVCSTGHCHPAVVKAIEAQCKNLIHICGCDFYYEPMIALSEKLTDIVPGPGSKRVFLTNSGAETVEAAIKLARHHTQRKWIISFFGAFHGRTMGALSLTSSKVRQKERFAPLMPMVAHAPYGDIEFIEKTLFKTEVPPDEVAAIFVEPILGEGGYIVPPPEFLPGLRKLCDRHGILLVMDEIQTGMGRTGKMFACEHFNVAPDLMCLAKGIASGMPIGALVASEDVMQWPAGSHGSTFGGNPISCAAALATIELLEKQLIANAGQLGQVAVAKLDRLATRRKCVQNVRGIGLMLAIDIVKPRSRAEDPELRDRIVQQAFERGLMLLGCGDCGIRIVPPLCINHTQLEVGLDVLDEVIATISE